MARTPSTMTLNLRQKAPDFDLLDVVSDQNISLKGLEGAHALLVMFVCNHCPFVIHVEDELAALGRDYGPEGVAIVAISSNDVENYPADAPDKMEVYAREKGWLFPYLYDPDQSVAKAYFAACTPDFYLFDSDQNLVYRGQLDPSRPGNDIPVTGADLREAIDATLAGQKVNPDQFPSLGCNIKWLPNQVPDYFG